MVSLRVVNSGFWMVIGSERDFFVITRFLCIFGKRVLNWVQAYLVFLSIRGRNMLKKLVDKGIIELG